MGVECGLQAVLEVAGGGGELEVEPAALRGADAVLGVDLDYEVIGKEGSMLMVSASGTAVKLG